MEIQLLGAPAMRAGSFERVVAGRQGAVLAALALNAPRPVSLDRLADVVWGDQPPARSAQDGEPPVAHRGELLAQRPRPARFAGRTVSVRRRFWPMHATRPPTLRKAAISWVNLSMCSRSASGRASGVP